MLVYDMAAVYKQAHKYLNTHASLLVVGTEHTEKKQHEKHLNKNKSKTIRRAEVAATHTQQAAAMRRNQFETNRLSRLKKMTFIKPRSHVHMCMGMAHKFICVCVICA